MPAQSCRLLGLRLRALVAQALARAGQQDGRRWTWRHGFMGRGLAARARRDPLWTSSARHGQMVQEASRPSLLGMPPSMGITPKKPRRVSPDIFSASSPSSACFTPAPASSNPLGGNAGAEGWPSASSPQAVATRMRSSFTFLSSATALPSPPMGLQPSSRWRGGNKKGFFLATSAFARILFSRSPPLIVPIELQLRVLLASQRFACWTAMPCGQEEQPGELLRTSIIGKSASRTQVRPRRFPNAKQAPAFLWERRSLHCSLAVAER